MKNIFEFLLTIKYKEEREANSELILLKLEKIGLVVLIFLEFYPTNFFHEVLDAAQPHLDLLPPGELSLSPLM